eukprot:TRINITY_DN2478_c0_g1_i1.p1 TRINITY_DN2478_c0_g1~~TRINITY_DN2478_c0_g1_i1.p1  ORF type:complete len:235 (+),score=65.85 TRINITY_DN2478_c0_g1_i1:168-872(+)
MCIRDRYQRRVRGESRLAVMQAARDRVSALTLTLDAEERKEPRPDSDFEPPAASTRVEEFVGAENRGFHFHSVFGSDETLAKFVGEYGGLKFVVDAKLVMYGEGNKFTYTAYEHGNAIGDSIGHFDRIILRGTYEKVKFNRYNFNATECTSHRALREQVWCVFSGNVILSTEQGVASDQMILSFPTSFPVKRTSLGPWSFWAHERIAKMDEVSPAEFSSWDIERTSVEQSEALR